VGAGKTTAAVIEAYIMATSVNPGAPGLCVVPDFGTWHDVVRPEIEKWWPRDCYKFKNIGNRPGLEVDAPRGKTSRIYVRSAHNRQNVDKINGLTIAWAYLEEAGRFKHGNLAWKYTLQRLRHKAPHNGIFVAASPRPGWLPEAFSATEGLPLEALQTGYSPIPDHYIRQAKTEWNTHNPDHYSERMRTAFAGSDLERQDLDGEIVQGTGLIYGDFARGWHVLPHELAERIYRESSRKIGGMDWGWSNPGASIWGSWGGIGRETYAVGGEWYRPGCQVEEQGAWAKNAAPGVSTWYCDPAGSQGLANIAKLQRGFRWGDQTYTMQALAAENAWRAGVDTVRGLLHRRPKMDHPAFPPGNGLGCPRLLISDRCTNLIREFIHYRDANDPEDDAPPQEGKTVGDDHALDALRYAIHSSHVAHEYKGAQLLY
jgi:hypothetical protein